jgi:choice-of-anchor A domain-containing protein
MRDRILLSAILLLSAGGLRANQLILGAATGYNAFILQSFMEYNSDSQGKMAVGGNFAPANGGSFTIAALHGGDGAGVYDLVVGGNFLQTGNSINGGDVYVGGNMTWNNPTLPHNAYVAGHFINGSNGGSVGGTIYYGGNYSSGGSLAHQHRSAASMPAPIDFASAKTSLDSLSSTLAADTANGTVTHSYSTYTLSGTDASLNVFNLADSFYSSATINITAPSGSTVLVNVAGTADSFTYGSINLNGVPAANVIFNFSSATSLSLNGIGFYGSILAPHADFTGTYGQINGELVAGSASGTTQLNDVAFNGNLGTVTSAQSAAPEPSTWLSILTGIVIIGVKARKAAERAALWPARKQRQVQSAAVRCTSSR